MTSLTQYMRAEQPDQTEPPEFYRPIASVRGGKTSMDGAQYDYCKTARARWHDVPTRWVGDTEDPTNDDDELNPLGLL